MNFLFDFGLAAQKLMPYKLRKAISNAWVKVLLYPQQVQNDILFTIYDNGSTSSYYSNVTAYVVGDRIIGVDNGVYECILSTTGNEPPNATYWKKLTNNFIGVQERIRYNGQKLVLEYALNRSFRTTFNQPPTLSDIYITNNAWTDYFYIGAANNYYASLFYGGETMGDGYIINDNNASLPAFTINVPIAVYTALGLYAEQAIRAVADNYVIAGLTYDITTY